MVEVLEKVMKPNKLTGANGGLCRTSAILFCALLVLTACRTSASRKRYAEEFTREFGTTALTIGTLKAIDSGDTDRWYHMNLIHLRESITRAEELSLKTGAPDERRMLTSLSKTILGHLEKSKERFAQKASTDYLALEVTKVLGKILTEKQDTQRLIPLQEFFSNRFVEERKAMEENHAAFND